MKRFIIQIIFASASACAPDTTEDIWGTGSEDPQPIMFEAKAGGATMFDQDYFISEGQAAFEHLCVDEIEWVFEIEDSVEVNHYDGMVLWRYVDGNDPVISASGYPPASGSWDVTLTLGGRKCYSSLSVVSMSQSSGYSKTEEW